jgi:hypothetical protein
MDFIAALIKTTACYKIKTKVTTLGFCPVHQAANMAGLSRAKKTRL